MDELTVLFEGSRLDLHLTRDTTVITTGSIAILSLSNKEKAVNTLDTDFQPEAKECLQLLKSQSPSLGLLVICSRLPASFLHGGDVKLQSTFTRTAEARAGIEELKALLQAIEDLPFPTVALLHATTLGGGLEVALACDYRFAAPDCKAIGLPELRLGVLPGAGGCVRLPRLIGLQPAVELILGSKVINATAAAALGVVNDVLPLPVWGVGQSSPPWWPALASKLKTLKPSALGVRKYPFHFRGHTWLEKKLLQTLVLRKIELATKNLYPAPRTCLDVLLRAWQADYQEAMGIETEGYLQLCLTTEAKALMSLFLNKSVLKHEASSLLGAPSSTPLHVLVLGSGWMGTGIGHQLALNGARVTLYDVATEALVTAKHRVGLLNETMIRNRKLNATTAAELAARMSYTTTKDFAAFEADAEAKGELPIVLEAAPERLDLKQQLLAEVLGNSKQMIVATNTSSIRIALLIENLPAKDKPRVIGVHFFHPERNITPVVEIIPSTMSSAMSKQVAMSIASTASKLPVVVGDGTAFVVNRIAAPLYQLSVYMLVFGASSVTRLDQAMEALGFAAGPFAILDGIGLKTARLVMASINESITTNISHAVSAFFDELLERGYVGRLAHGESAGFYCWKDGKQLGINPEIKSLVHVVRSRLCASYNRREGHLGAKRLKPLCNNDIQQALLLAMINEGCRIIDDGIAPHPKHIDFLLTTALGFPPQCGGLFLWADTAIATSIPQELERLSSLLDNPDDLKACTYLLEHQGRFRDDVTPSREPKACADKAVVPSFRLGAADAALLALLSVASWGLQVLVSRL